MHISVTVYIFDVIMGNKWCSFTKKDYIYCFILICGDIKYVAIAMLCHITQLITLVIRTLFVSVNNNILKGFCILWIVLELTL